VTTTETIHAIMAGAVDKVWDKAVKAGDIRPLDAESLCNTVVHLCFSSLILRQERKNCES